MRVPRGEPSSRPRLRRFFHRRRFYPLLVQIVVRKLCRGEPRDRLFVSLMGGVGDLVNFFPTLEQLRLRAPVEMATGTYPYRALVEANPHVAAVHAPFVYKPIRRAHRKTIERVLAPFYQRVILLDNFDARWWARGKHISQIYAEQCGCAAPSRGTIYLHERARREASQYLERHALRDFIYVAQVIRRRRMFRSWPLPHYQGLLRRIHDAFRIPILVDTTGSDERAVPDFCLAMDRLDILVAAAVIERARLFVGPDSGLTHVAAALQVPTVSIHLGYPVASCRALGTTVSLVPQAEPFAEPGDTSPAGVFAIVEHALLNAAGPSRT